MEYFVRQMQDSEYGVPVRSQKLIFTSVPSAFMGKYHLFCLYIFYYCISFLLLIYIV